VHASPTVAKDGAILFGSQDDHVYALEADGRLRWFLSLDADVDAAVTMAADGTLYVGADDAHVRAFR
jgi:outer membrane protein assembly factor BamB